MGVKTLALEKHILPRPRQAGGWFVFQSSAPGPLAQRQPSPSLCPPESPQSDLVRTGLPPMETMPYFHKLRGRTPQSLSCLLRPPNPASVSHSGHSPCGKSHHILHLTCNTQGVLTFKRVTAKGEGDSSSLSGGRSTALLLWAGRLTRPLKFQPTPLSQRLGVLQTCLSQHITWCLCTPYTPTILPQMS